MARVILLAVLLLAPAVAWADGAGQLIQAVGAVVGLFTGYGWVGLAISLYGGMVAAADARRQAAAAAAAQRAAYNASLQDRNVTVLRNDSPWQIIYGSPAPIGGSLVAIFTSGNRDQYKHMVVVFAAHECTAIDQVYIEGDPVGPLDAGGWATSGAFFETELRTVTEVVTFVANSATLSQVPASILNAQDASDPSGAITYSIGTNGTTTITGGGTATVAVTYRYTAALPRVNVQKHLSPGGVDVADAFLISQVPSQWTTAHRLSGYTYIVITLDLTLARFQGGPPNITAKIRGKKLYDYRTGTTAYSANPALALADFLRADYGFAATSAQVDATAVIAAANACDAQGYNCHGAISSAASRDSNLLALEESMAGHTHWGGGVWRIMAGAWSSPVMALTDADLAAPIEVTQAGNPRNARFNGVRGTYAPAAQLGVVTDFTPYSVASYVAVDGVQLWLGNSYPFTGTNAECQKLAAIAVERSRAGLTITYPAHLRAWKLQPGDRVSVTNPEFGFAAKTFRVTDWAHVNNAPLALVLVEDVASMYTGTYSATDPLAPTSTLADPWARPAAPAGLTARSGTAQLLLNKDGSITTRVLCGWSPSTVRAVLQGGYCQIQWRLATATDDQWVNSDLAPDASSAYLTGMQDRTNILVRVRFITGVGAQGDWTTILHNVQGKTAAPSTPSGVSINTGLVYWSPVSDFDLAGYVLRSIPGSTPNWGAGTPLHTGVVTAIPFTLSTKLYGVQTIMVAAQDTSGNIGAAAYSTFDFSSPVISNVVQSYDYKANAFPGTLTNCSVSGGNLVATVDAAADIYGLPDLYGSADVYASTYLAMQYVSQVFVPRYNGTLTLVSNISGNYTVEYQIDAGLTNDAYASADVYASADLYGPSSNWQPWPGALDVKRMQGLIFRISVAGGSVQGVISGLVAYFSMAAVRQTFGNTPISSGGTRLSPSTGNPAYSSWVQINTVQVTPIVDGSGAASGQILDLTPQLGPAVQLINNAGVAVNGSATIDIGGIIDV